MPYLKDKKRRKDLDHIVNLMKELKVQPNGDINYILFKLFRQTIELRYNAIKGYIAELTECGAEIRRRFMIKREDKAIKKNGDVY